MFGQSIKAEFWNGMLYQCCGKYIWFSVCYLTNTCASKMADVLVKEFVSDTETSGQCEINRYQP